MLSAGGLSDGVTLLLLVAPLVVYRQVAIKALNERLNKSTEEAVWPTMEEDESKPASGSNQTDNPKSADTSTAPEGTTKPTATLPERDVEKGADL